MRIRPIDRVLMVVLCLMLCMVAMPTEAAPVPAPPSVAAVPLATTLPSAVPTATPSLTLQVYDADADALVPMDLETYTARVTAGEMPASYAPEALAAQAVAARTLAVYKCQVLGGRGCSAHEGADVCTDSGHCQAYLADEEAEARWGNDAAAYLAKVRAAVASTEGTIICYDGEPIEVLYHAASGGKTEDCGNVFAASRPYLVSVSSEGESGSAAAPVTTRFTFSEFIARIHSQHPEAQLTAARLPFELAVLEMSDSGRVLSMQVGSTTLSGSELRRCLGLRSTVMTFRVTDDAVVFTTQGYGHGVGMSQTGAQAMALEGADHQAILTHYYSGVTLDPWYE